MTSNVVFKSDPEYWKKEYLGDKRNTMRLYDITDPRHELLKDFMDGRIKDLTLTLVNTKTGAVFTRELSDVSLYSGWFILSW